MRGLGEVLGSTPSSVSRMCDRLEALWFVARSPSSASRREVELRLTGRGRPASPTCGPDVSRPCGRSPLPCRRPPGRHLYKGWSPSALPQTAPHPARGKRGQWRAHNRSR
ncbi:MarR family transcriptional regulator [Streptomyces sp. NPDC000229]|uniref:MarR family transcriptional regulator n=1 Tax=Streptomyces sp. NPDC000229 TaxID=3154247 RepID=UPI0033191FD4